MAKPSRQQRLMLVKEGLSRTEFKSTADLADEIGLSRTLTLTALNLLKRVTDEIDNGMVTFDPRRGWKIAESWDDKRVHAAWLQKHVRTRLTSLSRDIDVAMALWGDELPPFLAKHIDHAKDNLDMAEAAMAQEVVA